MSDPTRVAAHVRAAFEPVEYPGEAYLVGSTKGCEPEGELSPFRGADWRTQLVNPLRYGATTLLDYARWRLSVFSREESAAIAEYLQWRRDATDLDAERAAIDAALTEFWGPRAETAPPSETLRQHVADQAAIVTAIQAQRTR